MDQFGLKCFLRGNNKGRFGSTSAETAQEAVGLGLFSEDVGLGVGESSESDIVLGYREEKQGAVTSVHAEDTMFTHGLLHSVDGSLLVHLGVELHHGLGVLGGISD